MSRSKIDFEKALNPEQLRAVTHGDGPQLVIAGAGSGKTRVITYRIAWLVQERRVDPRRIVAVTFTNKAAGEMKERVESLLGIYPLPASVGTFHRYALRLLRIYGERIDLPKSFAILDSSDQLRVVKSALEAEGLDDKSFRPRAVLAAISGAKNQLQTPVVYEREADDFFTRRVAKVYRRYQKALRDAGAVDFDDMIALAVRLLDEHEDLRSRIRRNTRHLLVDEFQDTNHAQLRLIQTLAGEGGNLTAVGDEDQGIYRWRGAELANILRFEESFPGAEVRLLERNYRSTQTILDAAGAVVAHNRGRRGKTLWTDLGEGSQVVLYRGHDERDEARWVIGTLRALEGDFRLPEMAVLVRTNAQTRSLEDECLRHGVPYQLVGGTRFYERAEIKDLVAYLRFLRNPRDDLSLDRILNRPTRGIGKTTQTQLRELAEELRWPLWEVIAGDHLGNFPARSARALQRFHHDMAPLVEEAHELPLPALLHRLLTVTDYAEQYRKDDEQNRAKLENVEELVSAVQEFTEARGYGSDDDDLLTAFLDHVALVSDTDDLAGRGGLPILTLHSAKGLEFKAVVVAGLEEKLLPHFNAAGPEEVEEERRLLYVGMTRAERKLFLTTCQRRMVAGSWQDREESRFLAEIPEEHLEVEESAQLFRGAGFGGSRGRGRGTGADGVYSFFGRKKPSPQEPEDFPSPGPPAWEDEPQTPAGASLRRGARVRHAKLGPGRILNIEGSGEDARLIIYFDGQGRRKLVAKYANLEVV